MEQTLHLYRLQKIRTPLLVIAGSKDSITPFTNAFVEKAKVSGIVSKRADIINESFQWLKNIQ